jgi:hypothetical protein
MFVIFFIIFSFQNIFFFCLVNLDWVSYRWLLDLSVYTKKKEFEIPLLFFLFAQNHVCQCAFVVSPETRRKCQHESTSVRARSAAFNHDTWNLNEKSFPLLYMFLIDISNICMFSFSIDAFVVCCYPPRGISNNKLHYQAVKVSVVL